ncbi:MAG: hypothetical protein WDW36_004176 [Sanguina aurantia]
MQAYALAGFSPSDVTPDAGVQLTNVAGAQTSDQLTVCFTRQLAAVGQSGVRVTLGGATPMNFAASQDPGLVRHMMDRGHLCSNHISLLAYTTSPEDDEEEEGGVIWTAPGTRNYVNWHGGMMVTAWVALAPLGIIIARHKWLLVGRGQLWSQLHRGIQAAAALLALIGFIIPFSTFGAGFELDSSDTPTTIHSTLGALMMLLLSIHVTLAFFRPAPDTPSRYLWKGSVYLCHDVESKKQVAIKLVHRGLNSVQQRLLANEAIIHAELSASNAAVVRIKELSYVEAHGPLDEDMGAYLFRQILTAVEQCHVHRVAYRDLKSDNCLLSTDDPPRLKLCDFGVSKHWVKDTLPQMGTIAGTPGYLCPEMLKNLLFGGEMYDAVKIDIWAMGALLSHMILGHSPFYFEEVAQYAGLKGALQYAYTAETNSTWRKEATSRVSGGATAISDEAKQLLDILLDKDPLVRPSIEDIQAHPWVKRQLPEKFEVALVAIAEEQRALAATHSSPQKEMPDDVAELVRKACVQGFLGDPLLERVNLRPNHPLADAWVKSGILEAGAEDQRSSSKAGPMTASASSPRRVAGVSNGKEVERTAAGWGGKGGETSVVDVAGVHAVLLPLSAGPDPVRMVSEEDDDMMSPFARVQLPVLPQGRSVQQQQQQQQG